MTYMCFTTLIARFKGSTWVPAGADRTHVGPVLATWTLLSGYGSMSWHTTEPVMVCLKLKHTKKPYYILLVKKWLHVLHFDGLAQERLKSSALATELCLYCTNPSIPESLGPVLRQFYVEIVCLVTEPCKLLYYSTLNVVHIGLRNGLLPASTKLFPGPVLIIIDIYNHIFSRNDFKRMQILPLKHMR